MRESLLAEVLHVGKESGELLVLGEDAVKGWLGSLSVLGPALVDGQLQLLVFLLDLLLLLGVSSDGLLHLLDLLLQLHDFVTVGCLSITHLLFRLVLDLLSLLERLGGLLVVFLKVLGHVGQLVKVP